MFFVIVANMCVAIWEPTTTTPKVLNSLEKKVCTVSVPNYEFADAKSEFAYANYEFADANSEFADANSEFADANSEFADGKLPIRILSNSWEAPTPNAGELQPPKTPQEQIYSKLRKETTSHNKLCSWTLQAGTADKR